MMNCHDCGVAPGTAHTNGCDVARCLWTGSQRLGCVGDLAGACCAALREHGEGDLADDLAEYLDLDHPDHECGQEIWDGTWPGAKACERLGFWCVGPPWVSVPAGTPGATHDLNRLYTHTRWDRRLQDWVV